MRRDRPAPDERRTRREAPARRIALLGALAALAAPLGCNCDNLVPVQGSTCQAPEDCTVHPSCARREGGCVCRDNVCYVDPDAPPAQQGTQGCRSCHGSLDNAAPPSSLAGANGTSELGVGAHQAHLAGGASSRPVSCAECHLVPARVDDPGHNDTAAPAEVVFGALATADGAQAAWDRDRPGCANYCHGATLAGGTNTAPLWTQVDGTQAACGTCHGLPPGGSHPQDEACDRCHFPTAGPNQTIASRNSHVDGVVQVTGGACDSCHGDPSRPPPLNASPPLDLSRSAASEKVGAHLAHLTAARSVDVACAACHRVPTEYGAAGHVDDDDRTAEVALEGLALAGGAAPAYDAAALSCSATYCHGATLSGGANGGRAAWSAGAPAAACDACHGNPPPPPHPQTDACARCHPGYAKTGPGSGTTDKALHVNGELDAAPLSCSTCHGDPQRAAVAGADPNQSAAPPTDSTGAIDPAAVSVGAHLAHVNPGPSAVAAPIPCASCHVVPATQDHADGTAAVTFDGVAAANGSNPLWVRPTATCSATWCHGDNPAIAGGTRTQVVWNDGAATDCQSCHGSPPPRPHPQKDSCNDCHAGYAKTGPATGTVNLALHVNGTVDVAPLTCTSCHGTDGRSGADPNVAAAPPLGTAGQTATSDRAVGAHQKHLAAGPLASGFGCADCHAVPAPGDFLHADGQAQVTFGALATTGGAAPAWSGSSCSSSYCHGAFKNGNAANAPVWTSTGRDGCGSCHGAAANPAPGGTHPLAAADSCDRCHPGYTGTTVDPALHVNGTIDVVNLTCTSCHGTDGRASVASADPNQPAAPPRDTAGGTAASALGVGAHLAHVNHGPGAVANPLGCDDCHPVPSSTSHSNLAVQIAFGALARAQGSSPSWNRASATCTASWCHGAQLAGATRPAIAWNTGLTTDCTSCHGNPPPAPHVQKDTCGDCHAGYAKSGAATGTVNLATHVNGTIETVALACTTCHGTAGRTGSDPNAAAAPPEGTRGETSTSSRAVGAHDAHLTAGTWSDPIACAECHPVPASGRMDHADGTVQVAFGATATTGGAAPSWNGSSCSASYCHGNFRNGNPGNAPVWTASGGVACGSCHGTAANPAPGGTHPTVGATSCADCHPGYTGSTVNLAQHVNGTVDVINLTCTSCHGDETRASVAGADGNQPAAPPQDSAGRTAMTALGVGAHLSHVNPGAGAVSRPIACAACHTVPTSTSHSDQNVQIAFGALARSQGSLPTWSRTQANCAGTWCHGGNANLRGGVLTAVVWNDGTATDCTSCHGNPPPAPHVQNDACGSCHAGFAKTGPATGTVDVAIHVNGVIDVAAMSCTSCHGTAGRTGTDPNVAAAPPKGTRGETATSSRAVGAHLSHLTASALAPAFACTECHAVPAPAAQDHADGAVGLAFGALARTGGVAPAWNGASCASTYCHGNFRNGNVANAPQWTGGSAQAGCTSCHGSPPGGTHPASGACENCHTGYTATTANAAVHVNGTVDVANMTCTSCHGTPGRAPVAGADPNQAAAPPLDTLGDSAPTALGVGAHLAHLNHGTGAIARPVACAECHPVPTSQSHSDNAVQVTFGTLARTQSSAATWTRASATCASNWCHGGNAALSGGTRTSIAWNAGVATDCTSCHGNPPPAPHVQNNACGSCHTGYSKTAATTGTVNLATHVDGKIDHVALTCASCHGTAGRTGSDPNIAAAPPAGTRGETATTSRAVGAHQAHLVAGPLARALACVECHTVPASGAFSHADGAAGVTFGALSRTGGAAPAWSGTSCSASYCHGAFRNGNAANAPTWTGTAQAGCGTCHGSATNPAPGGSHPTVTAASCAQCHTGYTGTTVDLAAHVNGTVDVINLTCTSCHGTEGRASVAGADANQAAAPPLDTLGASATTSRGVGAHLAHVNRGTGAIARPTACAECHTVPTSTSHSDNTVQVAFGTLARAQSSTAAWTRATNTCASTWCHGGNARLTGGTRTSIVWNNNTTVTCTSCHGNPPPAPHVQNDACGTCHTGYAKTGATTGTVNVATHVNGTIDTVAMTCGKCHGSDARAGGYPLTGAPPAGTRGETATTTRAVGAHQAHLNAGTLAGAFACTECHTVPASTNQLHANGTAAVTFGTLARTGSVTPAWSGTGCSATYCHGNFRNGNTANAPLWTGGAAQVGCTSCHGSPPGGTHPANGTCANCHTGYTATTVNVSTHVNGAVDVVNMTCTSCHGTAGRPSVTGADANQAASPPLDTLGGSAITSRGVGAHQAHVNHGAGAIARPAACNECHTVPTSTSHSDGTVQIAFGALARSQTSSPTWTRTTNTCASSWCHGGNARLTGGTRTSVVWTDATATNCTSCHGNPPPAPHVQNDACGSCHTGYGKTGATTGTVDLALHVNGTIDTVAMTCGKCHGSDARAGGYPVVAAPPVGTRGETATTTRAVGAHQAHLNAGALAGAFACTECHTVPASTNQLHANGTAAVTFGTLARTGSVTPAWSGTGCSGTYCHGNFRNGNTANAPLWTGGAAQVGCTSCHGSPPGGTHPANNACGTCHPGYTAATVNVSTHVNGVFDSSLTCSSCHGTAGVNDAPPLDTAGQSATSRVSVGAHQGHVRAGTLRGAIGCAECHPSVTSNAHSDGAVQVTFGALSNTGTVTAWNRTAATCASNYCHGAGLAGGTRTTPVWTTVDGTQKTCASCHGNPPPAPHVQNDACAGCHTGYSKTGATTGTVNLALHIDGKTDTVALTCASCHGDSTRTAVANADAQVKAAPPRDTTGATATTDRQVGTHQAHVNRGGAAALARPAACSACHGPLPTANGHANGSVAVAFSGLATIGGATPGWNGTTCASTYCHGNFNGGANATVTWTAAGPLGCTACHGSPPLLPHPQNNACGDCHSGYTQTTIDLALHVNGVIDGGGEPSAPGSSCGGCHGAVFAGMTGASAKASKHLLGGGDNPTDPGGTWTTAATLKASPQYATASCLSMCHGDHPHGLTSPATTTHQNNVWKDANVRTAGTRTSAVRASTDFEAASATGGMCLSCHTKPVDATKPGLAIAAYDASAHDFTSNAQGAWEYVMHDGGRFSRNCTKCHADRADARPSDSSGPQGAVHYSDYPMLLAGTTNPAGAPATFVCYNCHGNATTGADLSGKDLATSFAKAQAHPVNADARHSSAGETTAAFNDGKFKGANRHVNCQDCHDPHEAGSARFDYAATATATRNQIGAGSPLQGASGARLSTNPALWTDPAAGNFTFLANATAEYQVCFKCHTSFAFGATPPTGTSGLVETDLAKEFNPNNRSGHPVVAGLNSYPNSPAAKPLAASQLSAPWNTNRGTQVMLCSDCHGSDDAAPAAQGPHGSAASFMLRGVNRTWPGTFTLGTWNANLNNAAGTGLFCANCHPMRNGTTWLNNVHSRSNHSGVRCTGCHVRVPHGGKVSRLIATSTAGLPARYQDSAAAPRVTAFSKASGPNGYSKSNCSTGSGCHGSVTVPSPETW